MTAIFALAPVRHAVAGAGQVGAGKRRIREDGRGGVRACIVVAGDDGAELMVL